jgi:putative nucleotidyltransferase with HDIG domain
MEEKTRVLIADDVPTDADLCRREVVKVLGDCTFHVVDTRSEFIEALGKFRPDLILSDYNMPGFDGMAALKLARDRLPETPFIIVTGSVSEDVAVDCMKEGAWDYVIKEHVKRLGPAVSNAMEKRQVLLKKRRAEEEREEAFQSLDRALNDAIAAMAKIVETRDPYTAGHQVKVADLAAAIAVEMGLPGDRVKYIRIAALIHDIGKIYVPSDILSKSGRLREEELKLIRVHVQESFNILRTIEFPWPIADIAAQHHERLDGTGYPGGLRGDDILLEARILAVADVMEAMSSHRPYRAALGTQAALEEITCNRGKLYDPEVVDACVRLFNEKGFTLE